MYCPLKLKEGVKIDGLCPQICVALMAAHQVYSEAGALEMCITRGSEGIDGDGVHKNGSLHYTGEAVDLRVLRIGITPREAAEIARTLNHRLGKDFDVIFEGNHIHVEFDPK